jgi:hypothetical protein
MRYDMGMVFFSIVSRFGHASMAVGLFLVIHEGFDVWRCWMGMVDTHHQFIKLRAVYLTAAFCMGG